MAKLAEFKALLFDVDKTLLNSLRKLPASTEQALHRLVAAGYQLGVCTGRSLPWLKATLFPIFPTEAYHVICDGAQVVKTTGELVWEKRLPAAVAQSLIAELTHHRHEFFVVFNDILYATPIITARLKEQAPSLTVADITQVPNQDPVLIGAINTTEELRQTLHQHTDITINSNQSSFGGINMEMTALGVNKATGIHHWAAQLQLKPDQIIGFGDSDNDTEFLQVVGFGVAMGNATESVKAIADRVIGDVDQDGLGVYLAQLLEGAEL